MADEYVDFDEVEEDNENVILPFDPAAYQAGADFEAQVAIRAKWLLLQEKAKDRARSWSAQQGPVTLPIRRTLAELLGEEIPEKKYLIDGLLAEDGRMFLCAQAKAGKTTFVHNLIRSLVDGTPFLDEYEVCRSTGNIAYFDLEMSENDTKVWLNQQAIQNQDKLYVYNLSDQVHAFNILDKHIFNIWVEELKAIQAEVIVFDCSTPLINALGLNENSELRRILYALSQLKAACGAKEVIAVHHTGHDGSRMRGDSAANGWSTSNVLLTKDGDDKREIVDVDGKKIMKFVPATRSMSASGRDVLIPKMKLQYHLMTRHLTITGEFAESKETARVDKSDDVNILVDFVKQNPGLSQNKIVEAKNIHNIPQSRVKEALKHAIAAELLIQTPGPNGSHTYNFSG